MNLFRLIKLSRELSRMEKTARANPSPSTFIDLAQVYINLGWHAHTMRVAEEGLLLFPQSDELRKVHDFASRNLLKHRVHELQEKLSKAPTPKTYRELAETYAEVGDGAAVVSTCQTCLRRFPDDVETHLLLAEQKIQSFYRTLQASHGREAVRSLLKVLELDRANIKAHKRLAEVYFRIGAGRLAREHIDYLKSRYPHDEEVELLTKEIDAGLSDGEDLERQFASVQQQGSLANRAVPKKPKQQIASDAAIAGIREGLARIIEMAGVGKAAYIRGTKALVKGEIRDGKDPFLKTVRVVAKASQRAARRMDLGNFSKAVLDGTFGHICICSLGEVCAAVQCDKGTRVEIITADLQELVAGSLYAVGKSSN